MVFVTAINRNFDFDAPFFVVSFVDKEKLILNKVGASVYQAKLCDYRYMILTGFWTYEDRQIVELVTPLWTEAIGQYYSALGYPFQDPDKRFLKTLYWYIVREYTVHNAPLNKSGGKCQNASCLNPTSHYLNVHHGSVSNEQYVSMEKGIQSIVGQEHLHEGMLTVLCKDCHTMVTEQARIAKMTRPRSFTLSSRDSKELFQQLMSNISDNESSLQPPSIMTIGDMIKHKQNKNDK